MRHGMPSYHVLILVARYTPLGDARAGWPAVPRIRSVGGARAMRKKFASEL
jgi:hypothetical protein